MFSQPRNAGAVVPGDNGSENQDPVCLAATLLRIDAELEKGCAPVALGICNQMINKIMKDDFLKNHPNKQQNYLEAIRAKLLVIQTMAALCINQLYHYNGTDENKPAADAPGSARNPLNIV
jgi:hypothetical protein